MRKENFYSKMNYYEIKKNAYPYNYIISITAIFLTTSGIILCSIVLSIILKRGWKSLNIDLKLICFTLISDLIQCFLALLCGVFNLIGFADFLDTELGCTLNVIIGIFAFITSVNLVGIVAIERYMLIVKEKTLKNSVYYLALTGLQLLNLISCIISGAFHGFGINSTSVYCLFNLTNWAGITGAMFLALSMGISIGMIYFGYINIMIKRRNLTLQNQCIFPFKAEKIRKDANTTIFKSALIIIASTFTSLPFCMLLLISIIYPPFLTPLVETVSTLCIMFNMIVNTAIVLRLRTDIWDELKALLCIKSSKSENDSVSINDYRLSIFKEELNDQQVQLN